LQLRQVPVIVNLIRDADTCSAEAPGVPAHRVAATPFDAAEREVRRRVLRSLADRENPPTAVVFVRTWELPPEGIEPFNPVSAGYVDDGMPLGATVPVNAERLAQAIVADGAPPPAEGRRGRRR
jgi:hypothetical protein